MASLNHNFCVSETNIFLRRALDSSGKTGGGFGGARQGKLRRRAAFFSYITSVARFVGQEIAMAKKLPPVHPGEILREE
jgi:hypothetical protein